MNIVSKVSEWRELRQQLNNQEIGFVPTMGNLHTGHVSLCQRANAENQLVVASIFVNPTQFNQANDFNHYPRTLAADVKQLAENGVDYLFLPTEHEMYPDQYQVHVTETEDSKQLEGEFRPGHFDGMLTVVLKLLNLVQPTRAYFGEKDYQQFLLIKKMVAALFLPVEIVPCPTIRADDLLALSSRNLRLNQSQREQAAQLPSLLQSNVAVSDIKEALSAEGFKVEYVQEKWGRRLAAVWLGDVRLIDNMSLGENGCCCA